MSNQMKNVSGKDQQQQGQEEHDETIATEITTNASFDSTSLSTRASLAVQETVPRSATVSVSNSSREKQLSNQIQMLVIISIVSTVSFLLVTFSVPSLVFFAVTASSLGLAGQASYQRLLIQINQRGLLYYLPESVQNYIATTTLHEFMSDTTLFMEYRFLLLYFIPGLSEEQLMSFVQQLPDDRRQLLLNQGQIADILLPEALRRHLYPITESEDEMQVDDQMLLMDSGEVRNSTSVHRGVPSDLVWDSNEIENVNIDSEHEREFEGVSNGQEMQERTPEAVPAASSLASTEAPEEQATNRVWEQDEFVLSNAIRTATGSYASSFAESVSESILDSFLTPSMIMRSTRLTGLFSFSTVGQWLWSWSSSMGHVYPNRILSSLGFNNLSRSITVRNRSQEERDWTDLYRSNSLGRMLLSSTMFMGVSTGLMYYARSSLRRSLNEARERRARDSKLSDDDYGDGKNGNVESTEEK